ncbi:MAG: alpha/beta hydrolase [Thermoanaerobaculum sp.]|nr:alpha/beta hydrolase [Thermoanaerobaculum sp.]
MPEEGQRRRQPTSSLAWEEAGQGTLVVLLHGFPLCREVFLPVMPALAEVGRVVAVDLPGFGHSPPLPSGFSLEQVAAEVADLMAGLAAEPMVLVGHSMGGYVALALARQQPERLKGLVLLASHPRADAPEARQRREEGIALLRQGRRKEFLEAFLARLLGPWSRQHAPRLLVEVQAMAELVSSQVLVDYLAAMRDRPDHQDTWQALGVPTWVVVGEEDPLIGRELAEATAASARQGRLVTIPQAGHLPTLERPILTAETLASCVLEAG